MKVLGMTLLVLAAAAIAGFVTYDRTVDADADRSAAAERRTSVERDRDDVQSDVDAQLDRLRALSPSLGGSPEPVRAGAVEAPDGVEESILTGTLVVGDFRDVFVDEGIVVRGVEARAVDSIARRPRDTYPPTPQGPIRAVAGTRLVQVDLLVTNRTGDGADPACGLKSPFGARAIDDRGEPGAVLTSYDTVGTYAGSCGAGIADGASGRVSLAVLLEGDAKLAALQLPYLGEDSDTATQALVLEEPV